MTEQEKLFEEWWSKDGRFIDPDTSDVPWFDKRKGLASQAFDAAMQMSRNYTADDETNPDQIKFSNGRIVTVGDDGSLKINQAEIARR
jgi:hypothetical protein